MSIDEGCKLAVFGDSVRCIKHLKRRQKRKQGNIVREDCKEKALYKRVQEQAKEVQ